jgi:hypothetical protein
VILRRLAAYPRQNALAKSLKEIGRSERTLFMLDWISDPGLRRRTNAGLNKGEARNALARAVFVHRLGEIRDRTFENQRYVPPASISPSPPSTSGTPSISATPSTSCASAAKSFLTSFSPTWRRSPGRISLSTAITFGHTTPSKPSGHYEILAPSFSTRLSVGFREESTMMGVAQRIRDIDLRRQCQQHTRKTCAPVSPSGNRGVYRKLSPALCGATSRRTC